MRRPDRGYSTGRSPADTADDYLLQAYVSANQQYLDDYLMRRPSAGQLRKLQRLIHASGRRQFGPQLDLGPLLLEEFD